MLTPQEVAQKAFAKSTFGGYNMSMVDDFLDELTRDYEAIFNENALLKQKLKMLSDKVKEYQSTEDAMRKTLMMAEKAAEDMKAQTAAECERLLAEAQGRSASMQKELSQDLSDEEHKLAAARESVAQFTAQVRKACESELEFLARLDEMVPAREEPMSHVDQTAADIQSAVERAVAQEDAAQAAETPKEPEPPEAAPVGEESSISLYEELMAKRKAAAEAQAAGEDDTAPTRSMGRQLEFGKDFQID